MFPQFDRDGDGIVVREEFVSFYTNVLIGLDDESFERGLDLVIKTAHKLHLRKINRLRTKCRLAGMKQLRHILLSIYLPTQITVNAEAVAKL